MKLKRICILLVSFTICFLLLNLVDFFHMLPGKQGKTETVLRMAVPYPESHPSARTAEYFAKLTQEQTGGRIHIQVYADSTLGNEESVLEQMEFGGIALAVTPVLSFQDSAIAAVSLKDCQWDISGFSPDSQVLLPDDEALRPLMLKALAVCAPDYRGVATAERQIESRGSAQGLNIQSYSSSYISRRLTGLGIHVMERSDTDLSASLNYGYIDGAEMSLMEYAVYGYKDILPYLTLMDLPMAPDVILASQVSMGNLSGEDQRIIRTCAGQAAQWQNELLGGCQKETIKELQPFYYLEKGEVQP